MIHVQVSIQRKKMTCASNTSSLFTSISAAFVVFLLRRASFTWGVHLKVFLFNWQHLHLKVGGTVLLSGASLTLMGNIWSCDKLLKAQPPWSVFEGSGSACDSAPVRQKNDQNCILNFVRYSLVIIIIFIIMSQIWNDIDWCDGASSSSSSSSPWSSSLSWSSSSSTWS